MALASAAPATAATLTVLTTTNSLQTVDSAAPESLTLPIPITGLGAGETVTAIDFRPGDGRLYGIAMTAAGSVQLYRIDASTGGATPVGSAFSTTLGVGDTIFGLDVDFDPRTDQLRFLTTWNDHRRIDATNGAATSLPAPAYVAGDANAALIPFVPALAYSSNFPGATSPTAFGYEAFSDDAIRLGSPGGSPGAPDAGQLFTYNVSPGVTTYGQRYGFDVAPDGAVFLFARSGETAMTEFSRLFSYDLAAGTFTEIGLLGDGSDSIADIATQPVSNAMRFSSGAVSGAEGTAVTVGLSRSNAIGTARVDVRVSGGSSAGSADYSGLPKTAVFPNGSVTTAVQVQLSNDAAMEQDERLVLALSNPRGGRAGVAPPATATLTIRNRATPAGPGPGPALPRCAGKRATIVGTAGRDVLRGTRRKDVIVGLGGNDVVKAGRGDDTVCGGAGNDKLAGEAGNDRLYGQAGDDQAKGGTGNDRADGGSGNDRVIGEAGNDRLIGGSGKDRLAGGSGRDRLLGGPGRDVQRQ